MPEMKKVYNLKTGEERAMYSVDAREAVGNHPDEWSFQPPSAGKKGRGLNVGGEDVSDLSAGVIKDGKDAKKDGGGIPDGFSTGPARAVPVHSGETRMLVDPGDDAPVMVQPDARRGSKEEQIAASHADSADKAKGGKK